MVALRPGFSVVTRSAPTPSGLPVSTGTWFVVGAAQKGPTNTPQLVRSMNDYVRYFGLRSAPATYVLYDSLDTFFREGGAQAFVVRVEGASAVAASKTLLDASAGNSLKVSAKNVGTWGNSLSVQVVAGLTAGTFVLVVFNSGSEVERSGELVDVSAAYNWQSEYVTVSAPSSPSGLDPAVAAASALTGGTDDNAGINDTLRQAALSYFTGDLGPGQVSIPGNTTTGNRTALINHARVNNRQALLDATDSGVRSALISEAQSVQADGNEFGALVGPWVKVPGIDATQPRVVPPSALVAGLMARRDAVDGPGTPAAGVNGSARYAYAVTQLGFSDQDRNDLNAAGLDVIRVHNGQIMLYGYRTLGLTTGQWNTLSVQRVRMAIVGRFNVIADRYVFAQLDGRGHTLSKFAGELTAACEEFRQAGSLYGADPSDAYLVDVGVGVNTPTTIANNELHALVQIRISGMAELVVIELAKVANSEVLTAA